MSTEIDASYTPAASLEESDRDFEICDELLRKVHENARMHVSDSRDRLERRRILAEIGLHIVDLSILFARLNLLEGRRPSGGEEAEQPMNPS